MTTHNQDNLPQTQAEILAYSENAKFLESLGIGLKYADQQSEVEIKPETKIILKPELQTPQKIKSFRGRVLGTQEEYESVVKEVFLKTISRIYNSIKQNLQNSDQLSDFLDEESIGIKLLRKFGRIYKSGSFFDIQESDINELAKLLQQQKDGLIQHFPITKLIVPYKETSKDAEYKNVLRTVDFSVTLSRTLSRLKILNTSRELFENREQIQIDVHKVEQGLQASYAEAFRANRERQRLEENKRIIEQRLSEADQNLEIILVEVEQTEKALANLKAQEARIPKAREFRSNKPANIIPETVEETSTIKVVPKPIAVKPIAVEIPVESVDADLEKERIVAEQEAEYQKLIEEEEAQNQKIELILQTASLKMANYGVNDLKQIRSEVHRILESKTLNVAKFTLLKKVLENIIFSNQNEKDLILGKLLVIIESKNIKTVSESSELSPNIESDEGTDLVILPDYFVDQEDKEGNRKGFYNDGYFSPADRKWMNKLLKYVFKLVENSENSEAGYKKFVFNYFNRTIDIDGIPKREAKTFNPTGNGTENLGVSRDHIRIKVNNRGRFILSLVEIGEELKLKLIITDDHEQMKK